MDAANADLYPSKQDKVQVCSNLRLEPSCDLEREAHSIQIRMDVPKEMPHLPHPNQWRTPVIAHPVTGASISLAHPVTGIPSSLRQSRTNTWCSARNEVRVHQVKVAVVITRHDAGSSCHSRAAAAHHLRALNIYT